MVKSKKLKSKRIFKKEKQATVVIPSSNKESILNDPNRFFKDEMEEAKSSLFFT